MVTGNSRRPSDMDACFRPAILEQRSRQTVWRKRYSRKFPVRSWGRHYW